MSEPTARSAQLSFTIGGASIAGVLTGLIGIHGRASSSRRSEGPLPVNGAARIPTGAARIPTGAARISGIRLQRPIMARSVR